MKKLFNKYLRLLLLTNGLILISGAMLGPIYALFVDKIGGDLLDASLTGGIFALAAGITSLIAGRYTDKAKNKKIIVSSGYAVMAVGFFLYPFVDSLLFLFLVQVIIGFAEAFYSPAFDALYSNHVTKKKVGREWGAWESMNYFSAAFGAGFGGFVVTYFGFNAIFILMGSLSTVSALVLFLTPKNFFSN